MARREAYAYIRPASEEEKDFPQVLNIEGTTICLKESSSPVSYTHLTLPTKA